MLVVVSLVKLTHASIFTESFLLSAIAAIFAAIPFVGTYWAAIPAVIELWLVNGQSVQAILLLVCHMLPTYVVDTAILSEIKGSVNTHLYLYSPQVQNVRRHPLKRSA